MVSLQFWGFKEEPPAVLDEDQLNLLTRFRQHRYCHQSQAWKRQLNNVHIANPTVYLLLLNHAFAQGV